MDAFVAIVADVDGAVPVHDNAPSVAEACGCAHAVREVILKVVLIPSCDGRDGAVQRDAAQAVVVVVSLEQAAITGYHDAAWGSEAGVWALAVLVPRLAAGARMQRHNPCR